MEIGTFILSQYLAHPPKADAKSARLILIAIAEHILPRGRQWNVIGGTITPPREQLLLPSHRRQEAPSSTRCVHGERHQPSASFLRSTNAGPPLKHALNKRILTREFVQEGGGAGEHDLGVPHGVACSLARRYGVLRGVPPEAQPFSISVSAVGTLTQCRRGGKTTRHILPQPDQCHPRGLRQAVQHCPHGRHLPRRNVAARRPQGEVCGRKIGRQDLVQQMGGGDGLQSVERRFRDTVGIEQGTLLRCRARLRLVPGVRPEVPGGHEDLHGLRGGLDGPGPRGTAL
mmetsp:Transcript_36549/g.74545  ORF Transcript_36549/g.74545 Transcript_36549/m.74545 type:complete len:287 (+) Transcript_36549:249-1109(+)